MRIKHLLEGLNAQQRSVPQLPAKARARHISVLGAKTDPKHPFAGYMVGADESAEPGKKSIGPDRNDPYEKGWRAGFRHNESNPYPAGSKEAQQWDDGYAEAEAQPRHYDESVESNMPDLEEVGEPVESIMDAERRMAAGDRIFVAHEMDEEPFEVHNVGDLKGYTYDQLLAVPQGVTEDDVDEGWKSKLAGAALAGAAAFGGGGQAQAAAPAGVNATGTNAAIVQSLVNPVAQQRFAKMHADTTAKLTDPKYTHNPNAMAQHQAAPQQQHAEMLQNIKNIEQWDNPYRIIQMAMNMAGVTPKEVLQNLPKGYKLPTTEPKTAPVRLPGDPGYVREGVTKEDIITKLKAKLGDYLSDIGQEIRKDPDLINKLAAKPAGDQMGPPVKTVTTDDGHQIQIHGNEDDGFRISIKNKPAATRFKNLDEAVMACEMYCARRRTQAESADYIDEAGKDACYSKVKSRYKIWPSAYASGALVQCRKVGAANWGNKSKK